MANPNEILREERDLQPAHFTLKIESYSLLSKAQGDNFESGRFSAGGYKWKLILYPNGKRDNDGKGHMTHISLYLAIDKPNSSDNWRIPVNFKLFVRNKNTKWLTVQDASAETYFDKQNTERGFGKFLSLEKFNNPSKGYLVKDCCTFGAEVFVIQPPPQKEILSMVKREERRTYPISNFSIYSKLNDEVMLCYDFTVEGRKWRFYIYPNGNGHGRRKDLSLYMRLADWESVLPKRKVYAEYKLRLLGVKTVEQTYRHWFNSEERKSHHFMPLEDIKKHYLKDDDTFTVEVKFEVISKTSIA